MNRTVRSALVGAALVDALILFVSVAVTLLGPRHLGLAEYGSWQLHLFCGSYFELAQLRWSIGLHIPHGGIAWSVVSRSWFSRQLLYQLALVFVVALALAVFASRLHSRVYQNIVRAPCVNAAGSTIRSMCIRLLLASAQEKSHALNVVVDRGLDGGATFGMISCIFTKRPSLIAVSLGARLVPMSYALYQVRGRIGVPVLPSRADLGVMTKNVSTGTKVLPSTFSASFANVFRSRDCASRSGRDYGIL